MRLAKPIGSSAFFALAVYTTIKYRSNFSMRTDTQIVNGKFIGDVKEKACFGTSLFHSDVEEPSLVDTVLRSLE